MQTVTVLLCVVVLLVGLVIYGFATNSKLGAVGFAMFECGLLAFLLRFSGVIHL